MSFIMIITVALVLATIGVGISCIKKSINGEKIKTFLGINLASWAVLLVATTVFLIGGGSAMAQGAEVVDVVDNSKGLAYIAAALSTGMATIGAGIAVAVSASAALGAISEDSKLLGKTLIFVGLAEGIAIYGLIVSILILGQLG